MKFLVNLLFICTSVCTMAQSTQLNPTPYRITKPKKPFRSGLKSAVTCTVDTVGYTQAKSTISTFAALQCSNAGGSGFSQYFHAPQPITVHGFSFFAWVTQPGPTPVAPITVKAELYLAGADSLPTGNPLRSVNMSVTGNQAPTLAGIRRVVNFPTPQVMNAPYVLVVTNNSPNPINLVFNDWNAQDGLGEWLMGAEINGTWYKSNTFFIGGTVPADCDVIFSPHVTYDLQADFYGDSICVPGPVTVTFQDSGSPILYDRMYNQATFYGLQSLSHSWDPGDGSPWLTGDSVTHAYTQQNYTVTLYDTVFGWTTRCGAEKSRYNGLPAASFSCAPSGWVVNFSDSTQNVPDSWLWDFGDSTSSNVQHPTHTFPSTGTYTVCLTVTNQCGQDTACKTIVVGNVGVKEKWDVLFNLAPNPTHGRVRVSAENKFTEVQVIDQLGRRVYSETLAPMKYKLFDFSDLSNGVYLVEVRFQDGTRFVERLIVDQ